MTPRTLETATLDQAIRDYAGIFLRPTVLSPLDPAVARDGRDWVVQSMYGFSFADEFDYVRAGLEGWMGKHAYDDFKAATGAVFTPRSPDVLEHELADRLAIRPDGTHIEGRRGRVELGRRSDVFELAPVRRLSSTASARIMTLARRCVHVTGALRWDWVSEQFEKDVAAGRLGEIYVTRIEATAWPIYAGEEEERALGNEGVSVDPFPDGQVRAALDPGISNEAAIAMADALTARIDEGSTAATIRGRTGTQPADVDASETGTLLFTLTMSDPSFPGGADANPGGRITASSITADSSADATNTLTYCRIGATGTGADDHVDGSAGTSSADFIFNTVSIVSGANVSMSSLTITVPETN